MHQFIEFVSHHWLLSSLFVIFFIWLIIEEAKSKGLGNQITPQKLTYLINRDEVKILDIRDAQIYRDGHIIGAINIPGDQIDQDINKLQKYKKQLLVVVCIRGQEAMKIVTKLRNQGFEQVQVLAGGMNAWNSADMPSVKGNKNGKN